MAIFPGAAGLVLDSVTRVGLRNSQLSPQRMHYDLQRAAYRLTVSGSQAEIAPGSGPVLRLWYTVPSGTTGGAIQVMVAGYVNGMQSYQPVVATDNGTFQPT